LVRQGSQRVELRLNRTVVGEGNFRGEFAAASLKLFHLAGLRLKFLNFRGEFAAASLKLEDDSAGVIVRAVISAANSPRPH
ncbi:MAG: hypothetical protein LC114_00540, partial [Bryobacterales bacterium]|nr:hypothetical protein [Bryobacterales bacterium]